MVPVSRTSIESRSGSQPAIAGPSDHALVEHRQAGDRGDRRAGRGDRRQGLAEQLGPVDARLAPGRVERAGEQAAGAGRFDQADAAVDHGRVDPPAAAEVQHRRLGEAADDLVGGGGDEVGAAGERVGGQVRVEAQVRAPGLVDDQRHAAPVRDRGQGGDVGAGAEVGGGDDHRRDRAGGLPRAPPPATPASARGRSPARGRARGRRRSAACRSAPARRSPRSGRCAGRRPGRRRGRAPCRSRGCPARRR